MAEIYRAKTFDGNGQPHLVAVKRVLAHLAEVIQMLVDEAKLASVLRHLNIARVYEFARAHGEYFIAMEHVDGKDTRTLLERCRTKKKPIPPAHAAYVGAEVGSALHAAHSAIDSRGRPLRIIPPRRVAVDHHLQLRRRGEAVRLRHREGDAVEGHHQDRRHQRARSST
jgi:serine/threonine-protein kinase